MREKAIVNISINCNEYTFTTHSQKKYLLYVTFETLKNKALSRMPVNGILYTTINLLTSECFKAY